MAAIDDRTIPNPTTTQVPHPTAGISFRFLRSYIVSPRRDVWSGGERLTHMLTQNPTSLRTNSHNILKNKMYLGTYTTQQSKIGERLDTIKLTITYYNMYVIHVLTVLLLSTKLQKKIK